MLEREVTVISIQPAVEAATGDNLFAVILGEFIEKTPEALARIPATLQNLMVMGNQITVNWMAYYVKSKGELPYVIGSKWKLLIKDDGTVTLEKKAK
jgi:hypothetical protein